jgi:nucleoside-diphosphate-sugar epimerase
METILVTGSNGFVGEEIISFFQKKYKIIAVDKTSVINSNNFVDLIFYQIDINNIDEIKKIFKENSIDIIIHCAAELLDEKKTDLVWKTNYFGTKNLLDLSAKYNIKKFIFTSTFSIFEKNYDSLIDEEELPSAIVDYGKSKYAAENLILRHDYQGSVVIFRCPVIIGKKRLDKLGLLFEFIKYNHDIWLIGGGNNRVHFIYVLDLINAIEKSIASIQGKYLFNIGSDDVLSIKEIFKKLQNSVNSTGGIRSFPKTLGLLLLKILNFFNLVPLGPYHQRMLVSNIVLDTSRIKKILNWKPSYTNEEMLIECYKYYINNTNSINQSSASSKRPKLGILSILKYIP